MPTYKFKHIDGNDIIQALHKRKIRILRIYQRTKSIELIAFDSKPVEYPLDATVYFTSCGEVEIWRKPWEDTLYVSIDDNEKLHKVISDLYSLEEAVRREIER